MIIESMLIHTASSNLFSDAGDDELVCGVIKMKLDRMCVGDLIECLAKSGASLLAYLLSYLLNDVLTDEPRPVQ